LKTHPTSIAKRQTDKTDSSSLTAVTNLSVDSCSKVSSSTVRAANCFHQSVYHLAHRQRYNNNLTK